jgi:hypothetical protein
MLLNELHPRLAFGDYFRPSLRPHFYVTVLRLINLAACFAPLPCLVAGEGIKVIREDPETPTGLQVAKSLILSHGECVFLDLSDLLGTNPYRRPFELDDQMLEFVSVILGYRPG